MSDSVVFPCDTPEWFDVKQKLTAARNIASSSLQELIVYLQRVTSSVTTSSRVRDCTGARPKTRNIFADLKHCLDDKISVEERDAYLTRILLHAIDRAITIEIHRPSEDILAFRDNRGLTIASYCCGCMSVSVSVCLSFNLPVPLCSMNFLFVDFFVLIWAPA